MAPFRVWWSGANLAFPIFQVHKLYGDIKLSCWFLIWNSVRTRVHNKENWIYLNELFFTVVYSCRLLVPYFAFRLLHVRMYGIPNHN